MELYNPPHVNLFIEDHCIGFKIGSIGFKKLSKEVRGKKRFDLYLSFPRAHYFWLYFAPPAYRSRSEQITRKSFGDRNIKAQL